MSDRDPINGLLEKVRESMQTTTEESIAEAIGIGLSARLDDSEFESGRLLSQPVPSEPKSLLQQLRAVIDLKEKAAAVENALGARRDRLEAQLLAFHESSGMEQIAIRNVLSVSFQDALRPRIDPECWQAIQKWAVETGNYQILYKQVSQAKILELIENGVQLPAGVTVESYVKINTRRV